MTRRPLRPLLSALAATIAPITASQHPMHAMLNHVARRGMLCVMGHYPGLLQRLRRVTATLPPHAGDCAPCQTGKRTRAPFPLADITAVEPMDTVSTDTTGPLTPALESKARWLQVLVDRATRMTSAAAIKRKSDAATAVQERIAQWELQTGRKLRRYHADGARELAIPKLVNALRLNGTVVTTTAPHSPSQNADAERTIKKIFNATRAALAASGLPPPYWAEAALDAVTKMNHIPQTQRNGSVRPPIEAFFDTRANPGHLLPFSQQGFTTNTAPKSKLAPRALRVRYLRALNEHQYRVQDVSTNRIFIVRSSEFQPTAPSPPDQAHSATLHPAPRTWNEARSLTNAAQWADAHNAELNRHDTVLKTWIYAIRRPTDTPRPWLMTYKVKTDEQGDPERLKAGCAIRGDQMRAGVEYNPQGTASHTASHPARRLIVAAAAAKGHAMQSWDVPGAYPRAPCDPAHRQTMHQPPCFDGTYAAPGKICVIRRAMQGAPDAGHIWATHRDQLLQSWGWAPVDTEPAAFTHAVPDSAELAHMLADTDDFMVTAPSHANLAALCAPFTKTWQVTVNRLTPATPTIQHTGLKFELTDRGIVMTNPKLIADLLQHHNMASCNPRHTPHDPAADMSAIKTKETPLNPA